MYSNPLLEKQYTANGTIARYRIVKFDATDGQVIQAAAATDKLIGVLAGVAAVSGDSVRVTREGLAEVQAGGAIAKGDLLTSDANGKAVVAAPAAGVNNRILGIAERAAADGDIFPMLIAPSMMQGA